MTNEIATVRAGALPDFLDDEAGAGLGNVTADDLIMPRLTILQSNSPQANRARPEYVEGAQAGNIFNTATQDIANHIDIIPVTTFKTWVEWAPRGGDSKAPVQTHFDDKILTTCTRNERNQPITPQGNQIVETVSLYAFLLPTMARVVIPFTSTGLRVVRTILTQSMGEKLTRSDGSLVTAPFYWRILNMRTVSQSNQLGTWFNWAHARSEDLPSWCKANQRSLKPIVDEIKDFRQHVEGGAAEAAHAVAQAENAASGTTMTDDQIPF